MIIFHISLLLVSCVSVAVSSKFSLKGDPCAKFDSCHSKPLLRTCSCDSSCQVYGTCCHDMQKDAPDGAFQCYHRRVAVPVFAKRSCSDEFRGHIGEIAACLDDEVDEMDVKNNLLLTSHKTKITYWNKNCAACNNEATEDLELWNIEVFCPPHEAVNRNLIRRNLTFDLDERKWGLKIDDNFLHCIVQYAPPPYIDEGKHCTPNLISSCPANYNHGDTAAKCSQYYAERRLKNSETYYKNVHCAICNHVNPNDLECPGMSIPEDNGEETDFRDMVEEVFASNEWLNGKFFNCSKGYTFDPFKVYHCIPNLITSCPDDYTDKDIALKCSQYYAERKLKNTDIRFKNIHCAICNDADVRDLECPGMSTPEENVEETEFREMVEETFVGGHWLYRKPGKFIPCSKGFTYDPFQRRCRRDRTLDNIEMRYNGSQNIKKGSLALLVILLVFVSL